LCFGLGVYRKSEIEIEKTVTAPCLKADLNWKLHDIELLQDILVKLR